MPPESKAVLRSTAAPVSVVMAAASMATVVLPSSVLRAAASTDVSLIVTLRLFPLSLMPANVDKSPSEIVAVRIRLLDVISEDSVLASATVIDPLTSKLTFPPSPEIEPAVSAAYAELMSALLPVSVLMFCALTVVVVIPSMVSRSEALTVLPRMRIE